MTKRFFALLLAAGLCFGCFACAKQQTAALKPGVYTGKGMGHAALEVRLTVDQAGRIAQLSLINESESPEYAAQALESLPKQIVERQSLGIDGVAGATLSSRGILAAAADALTQAGGNPKDYGFVSVDNQADGVEIVFKGLPQGEFILTGATLKSDYEVVERDTVSVNSKGTRNDVHAKGVLLETILQSLGASQKDFASITANATDGYSITIPDSVLQLREILIAFEINGEALEPRMVIPDERAMYWVKFLHEMVFSGETREEPVTKELKLGELIEKLRGQAEDYKYFDKTGRALPLQLLLEEINAAPTEFVTIRSADGLTKVEKYDTFAAQTLVFEGLPEAPLYIGPNLPEGMRVKNLQSFQVGGVLVKAD
ncbi:MAG: FMN-binding protein [Oscillospiraceae bacterium]|jgi:uncharacterized protein with FMN-binding domain|nr:FMN-binding protein [Oscillospiraceae bacterium]